VLLLGAVSPLSAHRAAEVGPPVPMPAEPIPAVVAAAGPLLLLGKNQPLQQSQRAGRASASCST
jgi:hypothetical protein